jgi:redox-sensitive bicupin YhaK (pirin superfamily)
MPRLSLGLGRHRRGGRLRLLAEGLESVEELLVLGGQPIREPIAHYGPFVMNTREEIMQAMEDFNAGRMGVAPPTAR